jgi:hypothetical protein
VRLWDVVSPSPVSILTAEGLSTHGVAKATGLVFQNNLDNPHERSGDALVRLFERRADHLRFVILNACQSGSRVPAGLPHLVPEVTAPALRDALAIHDGLSRLGPIATTGTFRQDDTLLHLLPGLDFFLIE